jgi:integrase
MVARNEEEKAMGHSEYDPAAKDRRQWNVGRMVGAKRALKPQQVWAIRFWLDREGRLRDRAMFDLAIDSKLRGCDVVKVKIGDLVSGGRVRSRAIVVQQKTSRPVQFELLESSRGSILAWLERRGGTLDEFVFPSRLDHVAAVRGNDLARARALNDRLHPLAEMFYAEPFIDMHNRMKEALVLLGRLEHAFVRPPLVKLEAAEIARIAAALEAAGFTLRRKR